ncbi:FkbM family methyltransferase [Muricoccus radiodurans]|uniref:FkbM family methyltransferase n=1 Tax=Muricoccus radiodurans TaxID=2231721 RepID=UPI003CF1C619
MPSFSAQLSPPAFFRYALWRMAGRRFELPLRLRNGTRFFLRPPNAENGDYGVAYEIFALSYYAPPGGVELGEPRLIVDLGGNVGLSVLHWLNTYPGCTVETFEPNPRHVAQMRRNLALGRQAHRVSIHQKAAAVAPGVLRLSNLGTSSSLANAGPDGFDVEAVDVLAHLRGRSIDLLKMDIEGGEYDILADPRFAELDLRCLVMEWHARHDGEADRRWCERRLADMGFVIHPLFAEAEHGMFWAVRAAPPTSRQDGTARQDRHVNHGEMA